MRQLCRCFSLLLDCIPSSRGKCSSFLLFFFLCAKNTFLSYFSPFFHWLRENAFFFFIQQLYYYWLAWKISHVNILLAVNSFVSDWSHNFFSHPERVSVLNFWHKLADCLRDRHTKRVTFYWRRDIMEWMKERPHKKNNNFFYFKKGNKFFNQYIFLFRLFGFLYESL